MNCALVISGCLIGVVLGSMSMHAIIKLLFIILLLWTTWTLVQQHTNTLSDWFSSNVMSVILTKLMPPAKTNSVKPFKLSTPKTRPESPDLSMGPPPKDFAFNTAVPLNAKPKSRSRSKSRGESTESEDMLL
ncbi:Orf50 [Heliothis zea nudivirus]|uniref:Orf50 n=1 Tax=Heliothis zea nudivirus 1 TaxID=3116536 RepID=Q8JKR1_9VIRU|nr:Orf50 [Heliothis zea nudivirus]AAN04344.1 Orf50 [Heliothis zea nudivirus]